VVGQAFGALADEFTREHRADAAIEVARVLHEVDLLAALDGRHAAFDQLHVQRLVQAMILRLHVQTRHVGADLWLVEHATEVQATRLPVIDALARVQQIGAADEFVELAHAELGHDAPRFFGDEEEVVHHVLGLATELPAQHRILGGHAHRAGVEVALAHHDAALHHQRRGGEAELIGAQQGADDHIAAGLHLAVGLHADAPAQAAPAQAVQHQRLLRLGQAQFPGRAGVLDAAPGRSARAAIVPGDDHVVGLALGHASGHRADTDFRNQLDADCRTRVGVLQVVDELGQILDGVDVVVWRRTDQAHARHAVAQEADVFADLAAGQLATFAGLGTLGHLDLDLICTHQVLGGHPEAARGHLLDPAAQWPPA